MERFKRLQKNHDFQKVFKKGRSTANRQFVVYYLKEEHSTTYFRLGLSVSKKIGNAVTRNRVKRYIKEVFVDLRARIPAGYDYIIIARKPTSSMDFHQVHKSLSHVLRQANLLESRNKRGGAR